MPVRHAGWRKLLASDVTSRRIPSLVFSRTPYPGSKWLTANSRQLTVCVGPERRLPPGFARIPYPVSWIPPQVADSQQPTDHSLCRAEPALPPGLCPVSRVPDPAPKWLTANSRQLTVCAGPNGVCPPGFACAPYPVSGTRCFLLLTGHPANITLRGMEVQLTPDQEAFVRKAVASGRYPSAEAAVREAMARWEGVERARLEILAALDEAEADLEAGHYTDYTDATLPQLADELKREARERTKQP